MAKIKMIVLFMRPPGNEVEGYRGFLAHLDLAEVYTLSRAQAMNAGDLRRFAEGLELVADAERQDRIKFIRRRAFVKFRFFRGNVALNRRVRTDRPAEQPAGITCAAAKV